jgi:two-component system phosphate regulon response regulator PhoB
MTSLEHSSATSESGPLRATSHRVLVVDDNEPVRRLLAIALETAGFEVVQATTQDDAQRRLEGTRPDALILDLQRSEQDGLELLERVRARPALQPMPVVFLAGCGDDELRWRAMRTGADWFGLRPLGMVELTERLKKLVHTGRPHLKAIAGTRRRRVAVRHLKRVG